MCVFRCIDAAKYFYTDAAETEIWRCAYKPSQDRYVHLNNYGHTSLAGLPGGTVLADWVELLERVDFSSNLADGDKKGFDAL